MKVTGALITGGAGFLGSHLAAHYLSQQVPVICVDNFSTGSAENISYLRKTFPEGPLSFIQADVSKPWKIWADKIAGIQVSNLFHFASPASPTHFQRLSEETLWANTVGLREALEWSDSVKAKVTFASSSEVYGDPQVFPQPESYRGFVKTQGPRACYDEAKRFGEALIYVHNEKHETEHGVVRIFNTYGPRMNLSDGRVIINFLVQALQNEPLTVFGDGTQTRSFCYVDDLIQAIDIYASRSISEPVNIGYAQEITILELIEEMQKLIPDRKLEICHLEGLIDEPLRRCPDLSKAFKLLHPWRPQVPLHQGLQEMISWMQTQDLGAFQRPSRPQ